MEHWKIKGYDVAYEDETHKYYVNGEEVPSITTIMKIKFKDKYKDIDPEILQKAALRGTRLHKYIEDYETKGLKVNDKEFLNYLYLKDYYQFDVVDNEVPILLEYKGRIIACGRLDMVVEEYLNGDFKIGLGDIKRTSVLDKEYLAYQLSMYARGYEYSYDKKINFLRAIHLRYDEKQYVEINRIDDKVDMLLEEYLVGVK